jgi:hypothetical protein
LLYVTKQNLYKKLSNTWKTFLQKSKIWLETCNIGKELFLMHLKFEAFNNLKNLSAHTSNLKVEILNNLKNFLPHIFSNFNVETLNNLKNSLPHTLKLKLES